ncbi:MAG: YfhO family protein [Anaerolineae bacterium]
MTHSSRRSSWLAESAFVAALILLPLLFWWRLWVPNPVNRAVIPEGDFTSQYYPLRLFAARELQAGRLPTWDPFINAGQPGLADIQTGFFYPLNWLQDLSLALLGQPLTVERLMAQVIVHFSLASLFTYLLVRRLAARAGARVAAARFAGTVAALSFTYAGYLTSFPVQQITILQTAIWLPLLLLFLDQTVESCTSFRRTQACTVRIPRSAIGAGIALACTLLAGHPQTAMYGMYTALAYGLFRVACAIYQEPGSVHHAPRLRMFVLYLVPLSAIVFLGVALAAIQLVPSFVLMSSSTRAGLGYEEVSWGFPLAELTHLLYPGYFGGSPQYVGVLPLVLAVAALFMKQVRREIVFWIVVGGAALLLSFGGHTFLYPLCYLLVPGFALVRNQERIIYLFSFAVSVLAGYGALTLVQPLPRGVRNGFGRLGYGLRWVTVGFLALTAWWYLGYWRSSQQGVEINLFEGILRHHLLLLILLIGTAVLFALRQAKRAPRRWLMVLAVGLIWLNLFTVNWQFNLADPLAGGFFPETGLIAFLKEQPGAFRISSAGLLPGGASAGIVYELEDTTGNTPLYLAAFQQFQERVHSWRQWQLLNVRFVLDRRDLEGPGLERVYEEGEVQVYRVGDPLPRAWVVHDTVTADDDQALEMLNAPDFDPRRMAVLPPDSPELALSAGIGGRAHVVEALPGRLVLQATSGANGLLVISQPFYPGWQARVDGRLETILRVNYLLQGVPIPSGEHQVELTYRLESLPALISLAGLIGALVGLAAKRPRRATPTCN